MHFDHLRFIWGAEICCWQFNAPSTPLTDSSAIPEPQREQNVPWCRMRAQLWGKADRGQHSLGCSGHTLPASAVTKGEGNVAAGWLCPGAPGLGGQGCWAEGCTAWALHFRGLKKVHNAREISSRFWDQFSGHRLPLLVPGFAMQLCKWIN